jgi:hypothetical protein
MIEAKSCSQPKIFDLLDKSGPWLYYQQDNCFRNKPRTERQRKPLERTEKTLNQTENELQSNAPSRQSRTINPNWKRRLLLREQLRKSPKHFPLTATIEAAIRMSVRPARSEASIRKRRRPKNLEEKRTAFKLSAATQQK